MQSSLITLLLAVVFSVLQTAADAQYSQLQGVQWNIQWPTLHPRMTKLVPAFLLIVYFTNQYRRRPWMQWIFFLTSLIMGYYNLQLLSAYAYDVSALKYAPGLGTLWAYTLMQMDLLHATFSLLCVLLISAITRSTLFQNIKWST
jgi:hypothetical protein